MTVVRLKGIKRYKVKGQWYTYHRETGIRLKSVYGTVAFIEELGAIERKFSSVVQLPGTLGLLLQEYRSSNRFTDLAPATRRGYLRMIDLLHPLHDMPLVNLTPQFIASLRDKMAEKHGRRQSTYVLSVISVACEYGRERGFIKENPVRGIKRVRRARDLPNANRPWTESERQSVLAGVPSQLRVPIALAMFTGLRKGDVLNLKKNAVRDGRIWRRTNKTGQEVSLPLHPDLERLITESPQHDAITVAATTKGTPWTESGFNSTFIKVIAKLQRDGMVDAGLTFHGLRHTVGTLLIEAGVGIDTVRRWLGQKTLAMAIHYSQTADTSESMREINDKFDPLGSKKRTNSV